MSTLTNTRHRGESTVQSIHETSEDQRKTKKGNASLNTLLLKAAQTLQEFEANCAVNSIGAQNEF